MDIKTKALSSARWTSFAMLSKAVIMLLQMSVMARLLSKSDFGMMAMLTSIASIAQIFADFGISNAIIHKQNIDQKTLSSLYWLNVVSGALIMVFIIILAPQIAFLYKEARLTNLLYLLSLTFFVLALSQQIKVNAEKKLLFNKIAIVEVSAASASLIASTYFAYTGWGVYALVFGLLVNSISLTILFWMLLSNGWRPLIRLKLTEVSEFLKFGIYMIGSNFVNAINTQLDIFIGGKVLGAAELGRYAVPKDLAYRIAMIINPIVTRIGLPLMATANGDKTFLKRVYLKTLLMVTSINFPIYSFLYIFSGEIITIMLGEKWLDTQDLLKIFAVWGAIRSTGNPSGSLVLSVGRADMQFWWGVGTLLVSAPIFVFGSYYGTEAMAYSLLLGMLLMPLPMWFFLIKPICHAEFKEYFFVLSKPILPTVITCVLVFKVKLLIINPYLSLLLGGLLGLISYTLLSRYLNSEWFKTITELFFGQKKR